MTDAWEVWWLNQSGRWRYHATRPTQEWADNLAHHLTINNYPRRLYFRNRRAH